MVLEKITLQKCLLYFESLHGRPVSPPGRGGATQVSPPLTPPVFVCQGSKQEKNLVKPLYDRYQLIKRLLCSSPTFTTIVSSASQANRKHVDLDSYLK